MLSALRQVIDDRAPGVGRRRAFSPQVGRGAVARTPVRRGIPRIAAMHTRPRYVRGFAGLGTWAWGSGLNDTVLGS
jgi:hypothetical protein